MNLKNLILLFSFTLVSYSMAQNAGPASGYLKALTCSKTSLNFKLCLSEIVYTPQSNEVDGNKAKANTSTNIVLPSVIRDEFYLTLQRNVLANTAILLERADEVVPAICIPDKQTGNCIPLPPSTKHVFTGSIIAREGGYLVPVHYTLEINKVSGKSSLLINGKAHGQSFAIDLKALEAASDSGNGGSEPADGGGGEIVPQRAKN